MLSEELCRSHYTLFPMLLDHDLKLIQCLFTHVWQSNSTFTVKFTVGISFWIRAHNPLHKSAIRKPGLSKLCFIWLLFLSHLNKIMEFKNQDKFKDKFHYILQNFCKFAFHGNTSKVQDWHSSLYMHSLKLKVSKFMYNLSFPTRTNSSKIQPFRKIKQKN